MLMLENLPPNVFSSMKTLPKKINSCFTWLMTKEKYLVGNISGPTMEEFTLDKLMTVKSLLSDMKKTSNRSKSQQSTLEISMDHMHLLTLLENSPMKYLSPPFAMVSGCISLINKPTRFSKNCMPSFLDHIYIYIYIQICDEKKLKMLELLFMIFLIFYQFL